MGRRPAGTGPRRKSALNVAAAKTTALEGLLVEYNSDEGSDSNEPDNTGTIPQSEDDNVTSRGHDNSSVEGQVDSLLAELDAMDEGGKDSQSAPTEFSQMSSAGGAGGEERLPNGWQEICHPESGEVYYWNQETGETTWDLPSDPLQAPETEEPSNTPLDGSCGSVATTTTEDGPSWEGSEQDKKNPTAVEEASSSGSSTEVLQLGSSTAAMTGGEGPVDADCSPVSCAFLLDDHELDRLGEGARRNLASLSELETWHKQQQQSLSAPTTTTTITPVVASVELIFVTRLIGAMAARVEDWRDGGLSDEFFARRVDEMAHAARGALRDVTGHTSKPDTGTTTTTTTATDVEPRGGGDAEDDPLPPGWAATYDDDHGALYYHNTDTGESTWDRPVVALVLPDATTMTRTSSVSSGEEENNEARGETGDDGLTDGACPPTPPLKMKRSLEAEEVLMDVELDPERAPTPPREDPVITSSIKDTGGARDPGSSSSKRVKREGGGGERKSTMTAAAAATTTTTASTPAPLAVVERGAGSGGSLEDGELDDDMDCDRSAGEEEMPVCPPGEGGMDAAASPEDKSRCSVLIFSGSVGMVSAVQLSRMFNGMGPRQIRTLGENYYMASLRSEHLARKAVLALTAISNAETLAAKDWVPTTSGVFVRYVIPDDLKQPLFDLPFESFPDDTAQKVTLTAEATGPSSIRGGGGGQGTDERSSSSSVAVGGPTASSQPIKKSVVRESVVSSHNDVITSKTTTTSIRGASTTVAAATATPKRAKRMVTSSAVTMTSSPEKKKTSSSGGGGGSHSAQPQTRADKREKSVTSKPPQTQSNGAGAKDVSAEGKKVTSSSSSSGSRKKSGMKDSKLRAQIDKWKKVSR